MPPCLLGELNRLARCCAARVPLAELAWPCHPARLPQWRLMSWAWLVCLAFLPEMAAKQLARSPRLAGWRHTAGKSVASSETKGPCCTCFPSLAHVRHPASPARSVSLRVCCSRGRQHCCADGCQPGGLCDWAGRLERHAGVGCVGGRLWRSGCLSKRARLCSTCCELALTATHELIVTS